MSNHKKIRNCYNCDHARYTKVENHVACSFVFIKHQDNYNKTMIDLGLESLYTGWGFMKRAVDDHEGQNPGTGIMTNNVVIFENNFCCKYHEFR